MLVVGGEGLFREAGGLSVHGNGLSRSEFEAQDPHLHIPLPPGQNYICTRLHAFAEYSGSLQRG